MAGEVVVDDAAGELHFVGADVVVLVQAVVVDDDGDDVGAAGGEVAGQVVGLVVSWQNVFAGEGADVGLVQPDGVTVRCTSVGGDVEARLSALGGEVATVEQDAGVEAVVARVERGRSSQVAHSVVGGRVVRDDPFRIIVRRLDLRQGVQDLPVGLGEIRHCEVRLFELSLGDNRAGLAGLELEILAVKRQSVAAIRSTNDFNGGSSVQVAGEVDLVVRGRDSAKKVIGPDDGSRGQMSRVGVVAESVIAGKIDDPVVVRGVAVCGAQSVNGTDQNSTRIHLPRTCT